MIKHLKISRDQDFTIGLKLVRGAYLHVEPNASTLHSSKEHTDECYDNGVKFLLGGTLEKGSYDTEVASHLKSGSRPWNAEVMLATHNQASVDKALSLWKHGGISLRKVANDNAGMVQSLSFAQLMGMADEVSLGLVSERTDITRSHESSDATVPTQSMPPIGIYKYTIWGSFEECLLYMLRRAEENQDAVARTRGTAIEVAREVARRVFPFVN